MARRRRRGGRQSGLTKGVRRIGSVAARLVGVTLALTPTIRGAGEAISSGDYQAIPRRILFWNTGWDTDQMALNPSVTVQAVATFAGAVIVPKLIRWATR